MSALRLGIVAYQRDQQQALKQVVETGGHQLANNILVAQLGTSPIEEADAWLVELKEDDEEDDALEQWLDNIDAPILFCSPFNPAPEEADAWRRRLSDKINQLAGTIKLQQATEEVATQVWVLAASTGGPNVVKEFLGELPPKLNIGFIYVQHIDAGYDETLAHMLTRHSHYSAYRVEHGDYLRNNQVAIVPPNKATELLANGTFVVADQPWSAPYQPSVDSIAADVAYHYGERGGMIVFTGMGDDGAASTRIMHQKGGVIWAQAPASCTVDAMPAAAIETGCVEFKGNTFALAQQLARRAQNRRYLESAARRQPPLPGSAQVS